MVKKCLALTTKSARRSSSWTSLLTFCLLFHSTFLRLRKASSSSFGWFGFEVVLLALVAFVRAKLKPTPGWKRFDRRTRQHTAPVWCLVPLLMPHESIIWWRWQSESELAFDFEIDALVALAKLRH
jgi:hypothetical protein